MFDNKFYLIKFCIFLLIVIAVACSTTQKKGDSEKEILFSYSRINKKQSEVFSIDSIILLETKDNSLIGNLSDIIAKPSGYYVLDRDLAKQIVKFDRTGKYLYSINGVGRGPGEFVKLTSFCVDFKDEFMYLYDSKQKKVICYNSETGQYLREFFINFCAASFQVLSNNKDFIFYFNYLSNNNLKLENEYPQFVIINERAEIQKKLEFFDEGLCIPKVPYWDDVFTVTDSTVYCFSTFSDIIYNISNTNDFKRSYSLNYLNDNTKRIQKLVKKIKNYNNIDFKRRRQDYREAAFYHLYKINFTNRYYYFSGNYVDEAFFYLFNPKTNETINLSDLFPDVIGENLYFNTSDQHCFYLACSIPMLKKEVIENKNAFDSKILDIVNHLDENNNPIIIKLNTL